MFLLRAYRPARFRHAHRDSIDPHETAPQAASALAEASAALAPVVPENPHLLMTPEKLEYAVLTQRDCAYVHELYPPDDRERYRMELIPDDHPAAGERKRRRRQRESEAEARRAARTPPVASQDDAWAAALASLSPHLPR